MPLREEESRDENYNECNRNKWIGPAGQHLTAPSNWYRSRMIDRRAYHSLRANDGAAYRPSREAERSGRRQRDKTGDFLALADRSGR